MQRVTAQYLSYKTAVLGLIEATLSFVIIYAILVAAAASGLLPEFVAVLPHDSAFLAGMLTLVTAITGLIGGLYRIDVRLDSKRLITATGAVAAITCAALIAVSRHQAGGYSAAHASCITKILAGWLATVTLIRLAYGFAAGRITHMRRILLVGDPQQIDALTARLRSRRGSTFQPVILHSSDISWASLRQQRLWGVVVVSDHPDPVAAPLLTPLLDCKFRGMKVLSGATFNEDYLGRINLDTLAATDLLTASGFTASRIGLVFKRLSDILLGLVMLVLTLPLMALSALAIKIDSPGPVFYRQQRAGQFDKPFTLFKFRSMALDAEAANTPRWAQQHDPRITRVGRFIRATRIDELPQLVNVIHGEMSLIGPRPERPHFVKQLAQAIPFYCQRAYVKPGLTGWAQINFPYGASVEDAREKLAYDLYYVKNRSFLLDMGILLSTIRVVVFRQGAR